MINQNHLLQIVDILSTCPEKRTKVQIGILKELTQFIPFFQDYINKGNEQVHEECCRKMKYKFYKENDIVFSQEEKSDIFYLIINGSVRVFIQREDQNLTIEEMNCFKIFHSGTAFGEISLMKNQPRLGTVQCETECHFATLDKASFGKILKELEEDKLLKQARIYQKIPLFSKWEEKQLRLIYFNSFRIKLKRGEYLFKEGEVPISMNIICSGEFTVEYLLFKLYIVSKTLLFRSTKSSIKKKMKFKLRGRETRMEFLDQMTREGPLQ